MVLLLLRYVQCVLLFVQYLGVCKCGVLLVAFVYVLSDFVALSRCCCVWPVAVCTTLFLFCQLLRGQLSPHRTHLYSLVQLVFVCPSLLQLVHCICVLFMYSLVLSLFCL